MTIESLKPAPPLEFADHSARIACHEAAHATAAYLFGHKIHRIRVRMRVGCTDVARTDDVFEDSVIALAGEAFERALGLPYSGSRSDLEAVTKLLETQCSGAALDQACNVLSESALELASSERFHRMAFALAARIVDDPVLTPREILETLEAADPERPRRVEGHSASGGWWIVTTSGIGAREVYRGSDQHEAERVQRRTGGTLVGSIYG